MCCLRQAVHDLRKLESTPIVVVKNNGAVSYLIHKVKWDFEREKDLSRRPSGQIVKDIGNKSITPCEVTSKNGEWSWKG